MQLYLHVCGQVWMARVRCLPLVFGFDSQMHLRLHVCDPNMDSQSDDAWHQSLVSIPDCNCLQNAFFLSKEEVFFGAVGDPKPHFVSAP